MKKFTLLILSTLAFGYASAQTTIGLHIGPELNSTLKKNTYSALGFASGLMFNIPIEKKDFLRTGLTFTKRRNEYTQHFFGGHSHIASSYNDLALPFFYGRYLTPDKMALFGGFSLGYPWGEKRRIRSVRTVVNDPAPLTILYNLQFSITLGASYTVYTDDEVEILVEPYMQYLIGEHEISRVKPTPIGCRFLFLFMD